MLHKVKFPKLSAGDINALRKLYVLQMDEDKDVPGYGTLMMIADNFCNVTIGEDVDENKHMFWYELAMEQLLGLRQIKPSTVRLMVMADETNET